MTPRARRRLRIAAVWFAAVLGLAGIALAVGERTGWPFLRAPLQSAPATGAVVAALRAAGWPGPGPDRFLAPEIGYAVDLTSSGAVLATVEAVTGALA